MCRLQKIRERQADRQGWSCTYCEQPMWLSDPAAFAARHGLTLRQALLLQVTAEHLLPASDGGADAEENIARSEEHTSELQSLMRISSAVFCLKNKHTI